MRAAAFAAPLLAAALAALPGDCRPGSPEGSGRRLPPGRWGGEHVALTVLPDGGAAVEYDCAHGGIDGPLTLDREGRFTAAGFHVPERGGPVRQGEEPPRRPTRYEGRVRGEEMTLTVTLTDTGEAAGTFTLVRGREGVLTKCL